MARTELTLDLHAQPNDFTCGPTCLHGVYRYWGDNVSLEHVVASTPMLPGDDDNLQPSSETPALPSIDADNAVGISNEKNSSGRGTLAVMLGVDALRRGYSAHLMTFNLGLFDPTWFGRDGVSPLPPSALSAKLRDQALHKWIAHPKLPLATDAYLEFLERGGRISMPDLTSSLISGYLRRGVPLLVGLSSTYLYRAPREWGPKDDDDDIRGEPAGHFVVLCGYDPAKRTVRVADPLEDKPAFDSRKYDVPMARLVGAIMLGVLTYDGNLLAIEPGGIGGDKRGAARATGARE